MEDDEPGVLVPTVAFVPNVLNSMGYLTLRFTVGDGPAIYEGETEWEVTMSGFDFADNNVC